MTLEKNSYCKAMEKLQVTAGMRARVLEGARRDEGLPQALDGDRGKGAAFGLRRVLPAALAACLCLVLVSVAAIRTGGGGPGTTEDPVQLGNPIANVEGIEALKAAVPFPLRVPGQMPEGWQVGHTALIAGEVAQIVYENGEGRITYRMALGGEDISGDFNTYAESVSVTVGDLDVTCKGEAGTVSLSVWTDAEYTYALSFRPSASLEEVRAIIEGLVTA